MPEIGTKRDAILHVTRSRPDASAFMSLLINGERVGWTFQAADGFGWVLPDGRVSPALEPYRAYAEDYARLNLT